MQVGNGFITYSAAPLGAGTDDKITMHKLKTWLTIVEIIPPNFKVLTVTWTQQCVVGIALMHGTSGDISITAVVTAPASHQYHATQRRQQCLDSMACWWLTMRPSVLQACERYQRHFVSHQFLHRA